MNPQEPSPQEAAVRRTVGIAALRRLRRMVDEDQSQRVANHARARVLLTVIVLAAAVGLGFFLRRLLLA